jgi:RNA polymerase sigma-70 factor (ECF subfamily)
MVIRSKPPGEEAAGADATTVSAEKQLMLAARTDPDRFAPLYERYFPRIYAYCLRRTSNTQEAEDLTSTVFIRALNGLDGYRGGSVAAWLFRIAHNTLVNHLRDRRPQISMEAVVVEIPDDQPGPAEHLQNAESIAAINALVAELPDSQRDLLALKLAAGLTSEEIGVVLGKRAGTVRVELHRIIKKLRDRYTQQIAAVGKAGGES